MPRIDVTTIYGHKHQKPIVEIRLPKSMASMPLEEKKRNLIQLSVDEARDLALNLLQAAESAIQDAYIVDFFTEKLGVDNRQKAALLADFRQMRRDRQDDDVA